MIEITVLTLAALAVANAFRSMLAASRRDGEKLAALTLDPYGVNAEMFRDYGEAG